MKTSRCHIVAPNRRPLTTVFFMKREPVTHSKRRIGAVSDGANHTISTPKTRSSARQHKTASPAAGSLPGYLKK